MLIYIESYGVHDLGGHVLHPVKRRPGKSSTSKENVHPSYSFGDFEGNNLDIHRHVRPPMCRQMSPSSCDLDRFYPYPSEAYRHTVVIKNSL